MSHRSKPGRDEAVDALSKIRIRPGLECSISRTHALKEKRQIQRCTGVVPATGKAETGRFLRSSLLCEFQASETVCQKKKKINIT